MEGVELPPGSLFLSDPVTCILAGFSLICIGRGGVGAPFNARLAILSLAGLAAPALLMLTFIYFAHRYRIEFYPFLDTAACLGLALLLRRPAATLARWRPPLSIAAVVGVAVGHLALVLYLLSRVGPATDLDLSQGWIGYYRATLAGGAGYLDHHVEP